MRRWVSSLSYKAAISVIIGERHAAGKTQRDLAAMLKKPPSFVAKIENGERRLDLVEFLAIARALEKSPIELIEKIDEAVGPELDVQRGRPTAARHLTS